MLSLWDEIEAGILTWAPIVFMALICFVLWRTLKLMPRTKPQQIKPESKGSIGWAEIAGADEAKAELQEVVEFLREPERFRKLGRQRAAGHPAARPARHRQDAAGQGGRQGVGRRVLLAVGGGVRGDVRRPRRRPHPAAVQRGSRAPAGGGLHRRDRRGRRPARLRQQLRARADAQPAARRDGRLRHHRRPRRDRRFEPAREARPGAPAPGPLRPPDLRVAARRRRPRRDPQGAHARQAAGRRRPRHDRPPDLGADRRRPRQPRQRGGHLRRPRAPRPDRAAGLRRRARARGGRHAVAPHAERPRAPRGRLPRGRPRGVRRAAAGRQPRAQDLDRAARPRARVHAQPARGGPLPQDARGAARLHDRAARRAGRRRRSCSARSPPARRTTSSAWPRSRARWCTSTRWAPRSPRCRSRPRAAPSRTARGSCATRSSST